jgi:hypothetical protein
VPPLNEAAMVKSKTQWHNDGYPLLALHDDGWISRPFLTKVLVVTSQQGQ